MRYDRELLIGTPLVTISSARKGDLLRLNKRLAREVSYFLLRWPTQSWEVENKQDLILSGHCFLIKSLSPPLPLYLALLHHVVTEALRPFSLSTSYGERARVLSRRFKVCYTRLPENTKRLISVIDSTPQLFLTFNQGSMDSESLREEEEEEELEVFSLVVWVSSSFSCRCLV